MDKVVHFGIPVDDRGRAKEFYGSIFDWDLNDADMGGGAIYTTVGTVATDEQQRPTEPGGINGGIMDGHPKPRRPSSRSRSIRSTTP